jgi:ABC-type transport system substrate-binding protein
MTGDPLRPSTPPALSRRALLAAAAALAGQHALGRPARGQGGGAAPTLVIAQGSDVSRLDPHYSTVVHDTAVSLNLFDTLLRRRHDNALHPSVATEWERTAPTVWRFALRRDVQFHNGDPLTSADVRWSLERAIDPKARTLVASVFATVDRVEAPEAHVVQVHTKRPDPLLPARLAFFGGQILPQRHLEAAPTRSTPGRWAADRCASSSSSRATGWSSSACPGTGAAPSIRDASSSAPSPTRRRASRHSSGARST